MKGCRCPSVRSHLVEPLNKVSLKDYNAIAKRTQSSAKASYLECAGGWEQPGLAWRLATWILISSNR